MMDPMRGRPHMRRIGSAGDARFLTFSCHNRLALFNRSEIRDAFAAHLELPRCALGVRVLAWVIMPEHVHLIVVPGAIEMTSFLWKLKRPFANTIIERWEELNAPIQARITDADGSRRFWLRGGGYDRVIRSESDLREKIAYIHSNPTRRELVERDEDWARSSAGRYAGQLGGPVGVERMV